jgi:hypothetical protein
MPRSLRATRTALRRSRFGSDRANRLLISRQRVEKSQSPGGRLQIACRWSGSTTNASIVKAWLWRIAATASRKVAIRSTNKVCRRSSKLTVKNQHPPGTNARR